MTRHTSGSDAPARTGRFRAALACLALGLAFGPAPASAQDGGSWRDRNLPLIEERGFTFDGRSVFRDGFPFDDPYAVPAPTVTGLFDRLAPYGELIDLRGVVLWRPYTAPGWRPFESGRWEHTAEGWVWRGFEPWSGITDHTGAWRREGRLGWVWEPPRGGARAAWSPGRVAWRVGRGVVGWAPLGADEPASFVFVPLSVFLDQERGEILSDAEARSVFGTTRLVGRLPGPETLIASRSGVAPNEAPLASPPPAAITAAPRSDGTSRPSDASKPSDAPFDAGVPRGRFSTLPEEKRAPPAPRPRPQIAAVPPAPAPAPTPPASATVEPDGSNAAPAQASGADGIGTPRTETRGETATETPAEPARGPRVVGPQWLANGDCSATGIREGRCNSD